MQATALGPTIHTRTGTHGEHKPSELPHTLSCSVSAFCSGKPLMALSHQRGFKLPVSS